MPIKDVPQQARGFIVTMAAIEDLVTTGSSDLASPSIMLASITHLPKTETFIVRAFHENRREIVLYFQKWKETGSEKKEGSEELDRLGKMGWILSSQKSF
jgi:hypothetical protein